MTFESFREMDDANRSQISIIAPIQSSFSPEHFLNLVIERPQQNGKSIMPRMKTAVIRDIEADQPLEVSCDAAAIKKALSRSTFAEKVGLFRSSAVFAKKCISDANGTIIKCLDFSDFVLVLKAHEASASIGGHAVAAF